MIFGFRRKCTFIVLDQNLFDHTCETGLQAVVPSGMALQAAGTPAEPKQHPAALTSAIAAEARCDASCKTVQHLRPSPRASRYPENLYCSYRTSCGWAGVCVS